MSRDSELRTKRRQLAEAEAVDTESAREHAHYLRTTVIPRLEAEIASAKGRKSGMSSSSSTAHHAASSFSGESVAS